MVEEIEGMWFHDCPDSGPTHTANGEPCSWCDAVEGKHFELKIDDATSVKEKLG